MKQQLRILAKKILGIADPENTSENVYQLAVERRCSQIAMEFLPPPESISSTEYESWKAGLVDELKFWYLSIALNGWSWSAAYQARLTLDFPFQFPELINHFLDDEIRCLEVGTGALPTLGTQDVNGKRIITVATDALANAYNAIFKDFGISPKHVVIECNGENLIKMFKPNTFHLSNANNCLDHCYDPINVIEQMYELTMPTGTIVLGHHINVAVAENYSGLHQWNICEEESKCCIWNRTKKFYLDSILPVGAKVKIQVYADQNWINVNITKAR